MYNLLLVFVTHTGTGRSSPWTTSSPLISLVLNRFLRWANSARFPLHLPRDDKLIEMLKVLIYHDFTCRVLVCILLQVTLSHSSRIVGDIHGLNPALLAKMSSPLLHILQTIFLPRLSARGASPLFSAGVAALSCVCCFRLILIIYFVAKHSWWPGDSGL